MSAQELITKGELTPAIVAGDLLDVIKDIELSIDNANTYVSRVEQRGVFKSVFSSAKTDLIGISKSQNKINELMLGLIQEVITLNTMSYSFLSAVIGELEERAKTGWVDSEGRFQELSETGRDFAYKAQDIFVKIAEGSKSTQARIELNKNDIEQIKSALSIKEVLDTQQSQEIEGIKSALELKTERLAKIDRFLNEKSSLDARQDQAIQMILKELGENARLDHERTVHISCLENELKKYRDQLVQTDAQLAEFSSRTKSALVILSGLCLTLATAVVLNVLGFL